MARRVYRVLPYGMQWIVRKQGADRALSRHARKAKAIERARALAKVYQPSQLVIHRADGTVEMEHTYGADPNPPAA